MSDKRVQERLARRAERGRSLIYESAKLPNSANANVRGMGVAVKNSASGHEPFANQRRALVDAETLLLVDDRKRAAGQAHVVFEQRMGAE